MLNVTHSTNSQGLRYPAPAPWDGAAGSPHWEKKSLFQKQLFAKILLPVLQS